MNNNIKVTAAVSKTFEPFIVLEFKGQKSIMTPQEAIQHALTILENAERVVQNAFLVEFLTTTLDLHPSKIRLILSEFKQFREGKKRETKKDIDNYDYSDSECDRS
jgi:hypothetical protein